jgi:hypothetical protein
MQQKNTPNNENQKESQEMKITNEGITTLVANIVGIAVMVFGMSQETADVITKATPTIVGGIMSLVTVVTYLISKSKERRDVFNATVQARLAPLDTVVNAQSAEDNIVATAKNLGMI